MAIFLKYNCAKKILVAVLVAAFVLPLGFLPKKAAAVATEAEVAAMRVQMEAANTDLIAAESGVQYAAGVYAAVVAASFSGTLVSTALTVPTSDPVQQKINEAAGQLQIAQAERDTARAILESARTRLAQTMAEKEGFWDAVAFGIVKIFLNRLTLNIVEWIRTGYDGRPTFLTEPEAFFQDVGNQATGVFINEMGLNEVLCEPWKFGAMFGLTFQKPYLIKAKCTLLDAEANFQNMSQNFMAAGWQGFLDITVKQENNPYGAFLNAQSELAVRVGKEELKQKEDLVRGRGFFSIKTGGECVEDDENGDCVRYAPEKTVTPGSYIADSVSFLGMSSVRQAELADELNESLSVIAGEMIMQAINPNRGLANFDTVDLNAAAAAFAAQTGDRLSGASGNKLADATATKTTKESSLALIQIIYPIYGSLLGRTDATDASGSVVVTLGDIRGNNSCLDRNLATAEASGDIPAVDAIEAKINNFIATLGEINNKEDGLTAELPALAGIITSLTGWQSELSATPPPQPTRMEELTNLINGVSFPAPSAATQEYNDLVSKRDSAQTALAACGS